MIGEIIMTIIVCIAIVINIFDRYKLSEQLKELKNKDITVVMTKEELAKFFEVYGNIVDCKSTNNKKGNKYE